MSYGVKYKCTHKADVNGNETTFRIDILESGYVGSITEVLGQGEVFNLSYENIDPTQPLINPIQRGRLEFNLIVQGSTEETILSDIFGATEGTYQMALYQDSSLVWKGYVINDLLEISEGDYPYVGKVIAKDFTRLSQFTFGLSNIRNRVIKTIRDILNNLDLGIGFKTYTNWTHSSISGDILDKIYIDERQLRNFNQIGIGADFDDDDQAILADEALTLILRSFGLILRQANGYYRLYHLSALTDDSTTEYTYNTSATLTGTTSLDLAVNIDRDNRFILPSSQTNFNPGLKRASAVLQHNTAQAEIKFDKIITFQGLDSLTKEQFFNSSGSQKLTLRSNIIVVPVQDSQETREVTLEIEFKIDAVANDYYLNNAGGWQTSATTITVDFVSNRIVGASDDRYLTRIYEKNFEITSEEIPAAADGTLSVTLNNAKYGATNADDTEFQDTEFVITSDNASENSIQIFYQAINSSDDLSKNYDHGIFAFADGPAPYSPSALRYGTNDGDVTNAGWSFVTGGGSAVEFYKLLLQEILFMQSKSRRNLSAQLFGAYDPYKTLTYSGYRYFFLGGTLSGSNTWEANFLELAFLSKTTTFSEVLQGSKGGVGFGTATTFLAERSASFQTNQYITTTSAELTGTITSIPVNPVNIPIGKVDDPVYIFNTETGVVDEFTLSETYISGSSSINVQSGSVTDIVPVDSWIIYTGERLSSYITQTDNAITLGVRSADVAVLADDSIFTDEAGNEYYFVEGDYASQIIESQALINIRADQILAQVSAIVGEDLTVLNDIVEDIAQLQTDVNNSETAIDSLQTTVSALPTSAEFATLESQLEINTDSIELGVRQFSYALFSDDDEFITADGDTFAFVDNGDFIGLLRYNESLINVEADRIDLKVREIGSATAIGVLSSVRTAGNTYTQILLDDRTLSQDISLRDGDNLRLFNDAGQSEQVTVDGDQTLTKGSSSIQTIDINSHLFTYTYAVETSHLSFPGYQTGSEINVLKDEIVLKVDSNGNIASIQLDGSADVGSTISINADQITIAGQTTFLSALGNEGFPTVSGINVTIRSATAPTVRPSTDALVAGDLWIDTDDGDKPYTWNGSSWVASYTSIDGGDIITGTITANQLAADSVTADKIDVTNLAAINANLGTITAGTINASLVSVTNINASNISTGTLSADRIGANAIDATKIDVTDLFSENITIGSTGYIQSTGYSAGTTGFRINADGTADFQEVTIGGSSVIGNGAELDELTITGRLTLDTGDLYAEGSSGNYVILDSTGVTGVSNTLGTVFNLPSDGSAPSFSSGTINETIYEISTNAVLRTSSTALDGTASSAGVLINNTGIFAGEANQNTSTANVRIKTDGTAHIGDATNYIDFDGTDLTVVTDAFTLETTNLDISSTDEKIEIGSTTRATLGKLSATLFGLSLNTDNFWRYDEDLGEYQFKVGTATKYIDFAGTDLSIATDTFDLESGRVSINSTNTSFPNAQTESTASNTFPSVTFTGSSTEIDSQAGTAGQYLKWKFNYDTQASGTFSSAIIVEVEGQRIDDNTWESTTDVDIDIRYVIVNNTAGTMTASQLSDATSTKIGISGSGTNNYEGTLAFYAYVDNVNTYDNFRIKLTDASTATQTLVNTRRIANYYNVVEMNQGGFFIRYTDTLINRNGVFYQDRSLLVT